MKQKLASFYYIALMLAVSCQALYTVYQLGGTVGQGEKLSKLQSQQQTLEKDLQVLQETYSSATALTALAENIDDQYQPIRQPLIITTTESVASR